MTCQQAKPNISALWFQTGKIQSWQQCHSDL